MKSEKTVNSKTYLVLGTGVGRAIAYLLAKSPDTRLIVIGDINTERAGRVSVFVDYFNRPKLKCVPMFFDTNKTQNLIEVFRQFNVVVSALPAKYNPKLAEIAIKAGTNFCDLGGIVEVTTQMLELNKKYPDTKVSIVPDCGLMPGLGIVIAKKLMHDLGGADSIEILVGGLPQKPRPPTYYQLVFNVEGLKHICYDPAPILSEGEVKFVEPFHDYNQIGVPELQRFSNKFYGCVESFVTAGASLAANSFRDWGVKYFAEKTVRWPGFVNFFKNIPENKFEESVQKNLTIPVSAKNPDLVWMRVMAQRGSEKSSMSLLDLFDEKTGLTAMQRATGFTTAIMAEMIAEGKIKTGINTPENAFDHQDINELLTRLDKFFSFRKD